MSKKSFITAVSTAAMVATIGFAYAQSTDEAAVPNANVNGSVDNSVPKHWARDSVINNNPYDSTAAAPSDTTSTMPADTAPADTTTTAPADTSTSSTAATPSSTDATSPWAADTGAPAAVSDPSTTTSSTVDPVNQTNGSLSTNTAPSETRIDLNSPDDPIYNMGRSSSFDERAPRPDRN